MDIKTSSYDLHEKFGEEHQRGSYMPTERIFLLKEIKSILQDQVITHL